MATKPSFESVEDLLGGFLVCRHCQGFHFKITQRTLKWEVVVAQLVGWSLLTPEIRCSNPNIGKIKSINCTLKKKRQKYSFRGLEWPIVKKRTLNLRLNYSYVNHSFSCRIISKNLGFHVRFSFRLIGLLTQIALGYYILPSTHN